MEESVKFGTKNHFYIRNKFSLGATCANYPRGGGGGGGGGEDRNFNRPLSIF